ncbi:MAG: hypothetical protein M1826_007549 [Phylliscum demangeonii]|nr:MAG: hypothetical protein M1826_007549 [Phylliscum demangeonii]
MHHLADVETVVNHSLSIRSKKDHHVGNDKSASGITGSGGRHRFSMATLRGLQQPEMSKKLFKLIKMENHCIGAYEAAGRERHSIASQLSDWGEGTGDDAVSELSDKLGVLLSELGEQEHVFAENLEEYRALLKQIRNTESSVQPSRDHHAKVADEIQRLRLKEPTSVKLVQLEQELVRAEAENLVAEAQLTNITRQKLKEAYDHHFAAVIERAEKQALLARHGRRLLNLLDDTPLVPGDSRPPFEHASEARQILNDAEDDLRDWHPDLEPVTTSAAALDDTLMPAASSTTTMTTAETAPAEMTSTPMTTTAPHHQHDPRVLSSETSQPESTSVVDDAGPMYAYDAAGVTTIGDAPAQALEYTTAAGAAIHRTPGETHYVPEAIS